MAASSPARESWPLLKGLKLLHRGKVRDIYELPDGDLLFVTTDGISIFDFVLDALVPMKGVMLNALNHFWLKKLEQLGFLTHFVAAGPDIDQYLPEELRGNIDLQSRAMVVCNLHVYPYEHVFRVCLTGSALKEYIATGMVAGQKLPSGLQDGDELPFTLFTPTTKEADGHDRPTNAREVEACYPVMIRNLTKVVQFASNFARSRRLVLADTKFEGSGDVIGDEVLTTDSSRYWDLREWQESRKVETGRKAPTSLDKELVRIWGKSVGIDKLNPENPEDVAKVHSIKLPENVIANKVATDRYFFWRLTGDTIEEYLSDEMKVFVPARPPKRVAVICGSDSDKADVMAVLSHIHPDMAKIDLHIMSCHRNPEETADFAKNATPKPDVIVCVGSKAFHLPGDIDAFAHAAGRDIPVIGVALGEPGSRALLAAQLSIEEIPGQPVIMDEITGKVYTGQDGFVNAMARITYGELPPAKPRKEKPVQRNVWSNSKK